jgi:hypothetical protein
MQTADASERSSFHTHDPVISTLACNYAIPNTPAFCALLNFPFDDRWANDTLILQHRHSRARTHAPLLTHTQDPENYITIRDQLLGAGWVVVAPTTGVLDVLGRQVGYEASARASSARSKLPVKLQVGAPASPVACRLCHQKHH